jgi:hypothetical protein
MERRPIDVLDPHYRFTDIVCSGRGTPGGAVHRVASTQESRLFRCPGAAFLQRCRGDNGSEFGEDLRVVAFEIVAEPGSTSVLAG